MRQLCTLITIVLVSASASAQQPPAAAGAALKNFQTSADVTAIVARLKTQQPAQPLRASPLFQAPPYTVNIEYRTAVATSAVHETESELFYVIDGAGRSE